MDEVFIYHGTLSCGMEFFHKAAHLGALQKIDPAPLDKRQGKVICGILSLFKKIYLYFYTGERK